MVYVVALLSIAAGAVAQYLLKVGAVATLNGENPLMTKILSLITDVNFMAGILFYGISLVLWMYVLSQLELTKAYPMVSLGYVFAFILGYWLLGEPISASRVIGLVLIVSGVFFIARS